MSTIIIKSKKKVSWIDIAELWDHKELIYFFAWKDLKVRYKQTILGVLWAVFQPLATVSIFTIFFGHFANIQTGNIPYPLFAFVGILFWQFFSSSLTDISNVIINNQAVITKVYFPRLILPISVITTKLVDLFINSILLLCLLVYYDFVPNVVSIIVIPVSMLITFMTAMGTGLILASINVKYRDVKHAIPFFIQILIFITPVIYPSSITGSYSYLLAVNPLTGAIESARSVLIGSAQIDWLLVLFSFMISSLLLLSGLYIFKKTEAYFADII